MGVVVTGASALVSAVAAMQPNSLDIVGEMGLKPGRWRTTIQIVDAAIVPTPGRPVPAGAAERLKQAIGSSMDTEDCIGSIRPPGSDLVLPGIKIEAACVLGEVEADQRILRIKGTCGSMAKGFKADMNVQAAHSATAMTANVESLAFSEGVGFSTRIVVTTNSKYMGQCPAS
ncbi:MAG: DUF3617 family protein [Proteobacteria bacterium]|nr:DUF3617 family protein [Pseudomonadota bacterium]